MKHLICLLALAFAVPAFAGDVQVQVTGTVVSGTAPTNGPLAGVVVGDAVLLSYEIDFPVNGNPSSGQTSMWMDNPTFQLQIGGAIETHRYPVGGVCWWIDGATGIDGMHLRGEALSTLGLRIELRLNDSTATVFGAPDPLVLAGTYGPADFDDVTWRLMGGSNLEISFQSLTITTPAVGTSYCGPAIVNSSGAGGALSAIGTDRVAGRRLRLQAMSLPPQTFAYVLVSQMQGLTQQPGGSAGTLCLGGAIGRYAGDIMNTGAAGQFAMEVDIFAMPTPTGSVGLQPGQTWNFQAWYRDANPIVTSNFTDGVSVLFR